MTTVNSDVLIYNQLAQTSYLERLQDVTQVFNAQSRGAILLTDELIEGDFEKNAFYKLGGEIAHRDVNSLAPVTPDKIAMGEMVGVKVPFKYGPYETTEEAFKRRARSVDEFSVIVGQDYADAQVAYAFKLATASLTGAINTNPNMLATGSLATDGKKALTAAMRKYGDRFSRIAIWLMDSATYFDIVDGAITDQVFNEADVVIYGGSPGTLGIPVLVTDQAPANTVFALQSNAVELKTSQLPAFRAYEDNTKENLIIGVRAEGVFNINVLGYSYLEANGANPDAAALSIPSAWEKYATSDKATAGVILTLS